nr:hypothetical protein L204_03657 [Cryptococcus depauperatus CBS 7855]
MGHSTIPPHLITLLSSAQTDINYATDGLEEWIIHRRSKGDTLFDVSVGLAELEDKIPPHLTYAFDRARYLTNVPQPADLTPPMGPFPLVKSSSTATILNHLMSLPPPSIQHSREVILEYVLARETKLKEKKAGRAGKGTLGREGFEDLARRMGELEEALRGDSTTIKREATPSSPSRDLYPTPRSPQQLQQSLNENQQIGLTLILSLRMSLSYFTLQEVAGQLLLLALGDAERMLVQHIRRRVPGEGRWSVGKELEYIESLVLHRRPVLRPTFRSAKARTLLPSKPLYPIQLPAPSKSQCIKQIQSLIKEYDAGGPLGAAEFLQSHVPSGIASGMFTSTRERHFLGKKSSTASPTIATFTRESSPTTSNSKPSLSSHTPGSPIRTPHADDNILANYTLEIISEYITREKREHMLKSKWAKSGRAQLSKDLGEIEFVFCLASRNTASSLAPHLLPTFLLLRRTFALLPSPLPQSITEPYINILPALPEPDEVSFREPTVSATTAALYVNPRLDNDKAYEVLEELVEFEKEKIEGISGTRQELTEWIVEQIEAVQRRFPDGSYEDVFNRMKDLTLNCPKVSPPPQQSITFAQMPTIHRRTKSNAFPLPSRPSSSDSGSPVAMNLLKAQHARSVSMPDRKETYQSDSDTDSDSDSDSDSDELPTRASSPAPVPLQDAQITLQAQPTIETSIPNAASLVFPPVEIEDHRSSTASGDASSGGWWDVVSAVDREGSAPVPWKDGLENRPEEHAGHLSQPSIGSLIGNDSSQSSAMDVVSPLKRNVEAFLPPGAEPAQILDFTRPINHLEFSSRSFHPVPIPSPPNSASTLRQGEYLPGQDIHPPSTPFILPKPQNDVAVEKEENISPPLKLTEIEQPKNPMLENNEMNAHAGVREPKTEEFTTTSTLISTPSARSSATLSTMQAFTTTASTLPIKNTLPTAMSAAIRNHDSTATTPPFAPDVPVMSTANTLIFPSNPDFNPPASTISSKSIFGRSMSLVRHKSKGKKDKSKKDEEKENVKAKQRVMNDPGRWNKGMVADIMGPPAR